VYILLLVDKTYSEQNKIAGEIEIEDYG